MLLLWYTIMDGKYDPLPLHNFTSDWHAMLHHIQDPMVQHFHDSWMLWLLVTLHTIQIPMVEMLTSVVSLTSESSENWHASPLPHGPRFLIALCWRDSPSLRHGNHQKTFSSMSRSPKWLRFRRFGTWRSRRRTPVSFHSTRRSSNPIFRLSKQ